MTAQEIFYVYGTVIVEFLAELYVFYFLFALGLPRKPQFILRLALSALCVFALAIPVAVFYTAFGVTVWGRVIVYIVLFGLVFGQGILLFDVPRWSVLFVASAAYAVQNLVYQLYLFQYYLGKLGGGYDFPDSALGVFLYRLMYYGIFAALAVIMWFVAVKKMSSRLAMGRLDHRIFAIALAILAVTVLLCSLEDVYFESLGLGVAVSNIGYSDLFGLRLTCIALSAVCGVTTLLLMNKTLEQRDLKLEVERLQHVVKQSEQQYHISKDTIDMINLKCHDMKYKLDAAINGSGLQPEAFDDLRRSIAIYDSSIETGNRLLNVLFTEKSLYCEQHGITLTCMIDGARLSFIADGDLYCLFGNIMDNALEAVTRITEREKRVINIVVKARESMTVVTAENFFVGDIAFENGLPKTSKPEKDYHGFGLSSMRMIVRHYGGEMTVNTDGDVFRVTALFPRADEFCEQNK